MQDVVADNEVSDKVTPDGGTELRLFRGVVRSLTSDAMNALDDLETWCRDANQRERCVAVRHYLNYMQGLCDGKR